MITDSAEVADVALASFGRRVAGLFVDQLVIMVPVLFFATLAGFAAREVFADSAEVAFSVGVSLLALVYETAMVALFGRTLGKVATGTKVVTVVGHERPGWGSAALRSLVPLAASSVPVVGLPLGLGAYALAFFNPLRQGLHDRAAGTIVITATLAD